VPVDDAEVVLVGQNAVNHQLGDLVEEMGVQALVTLEHCDGEPVVVGVCVVVVPVVNVGLLRVAQVLHRLGTGDELVPLLDEGCAHSGRDHLGEHHQAVELGVHRDLRRDEGGAGSDHVGLGCGSHCFWRFGVVRQSDLHTFSTWYRQFREKKVTLQRVVGVCQFKPAQERAAP